MLFFVEVISCFVANCSNTFFGVEKRRKGVIGGEHTISKFCRVMSYFDSVTNDSSGKLFRFQYVQVHALKTLPANFFFFLHLAFAWTCTHLSFIAMSVRHTSSPDGSPPSLGTTGWGMRVTAGENSNPDRCIQQISMLGHSCPCHSPPTSTTADPDFSFCVKE